LHEDPRGREERIPDEKYDAKCVKLNNNHIEDATGLLSVLEEITLQPAAITWIDLSFNSLQKIDPVREMSNCNYGFYGYHPMIQVIFPATAHF